MSTAVCRLCGHDPGAPERGSGPVHRGEITADLQVGGEQPGLAPPRLGICRTRHRPSPPLGPEPVPVHQPDNTTIPSYLRRRVLIRPRADAKGARLQNRYPERSQAALARPPRPVVGGPPGGIASTRDLLSFTVASLAGVYRDWRAHRMFRAAFQAIYSKTQEVGYAPDRLAPRHPRPWRNHARHDRNKRNAGRHRPPAPPATFLLNVLPDDGENAIYNFVNSATSSVDVTIYELKDVTLENDLVAREKAGRQRPGDPGPGAEVIRHRRLQRPDSGRGRRGLVVHRFTYTHQKTITVNNRRVLRQHRQLRHDLLRHLPRLRRLRHRRQRRGRDRGGLQRRLRALPRSPRPTATTWCGRRPTHRATCWR